MTRSFKHILLLAILLCSALSTGLGAAPAHAEVQIHFHSFNGSVLWGRVPHTFIVLDGTLEETGEQVNENYGFSARSSAASSPTRSTRASAR